MEERHKKVLEKKQLIINKKFKSIIVDGIDKENELRFCIENDSEWTYIFLNRKQARRVVNFLIGELRKIDATQPKTVKP